ncbi:MAG TPA: sigma-54 dependent transcriptional regulator [bacterium]|nr:sigma-54 dependent transcriptional regulator [bacterium]
MIKKILICDDEANVRVFLKDLLVLEGFSVVEAESGATALDSVARDKPDLCILDLMLPDCNGVELLPRLKAASPSLAVIVITALGTIDNAVLSMKAGAYDFITKPFDVDTILMSVKRALDFIVVSRENTVLWNLHKNRIYFEDFIGDCQQIQAIRSLIPKLAYADVPILITGETGTGKNVLAKQIHFTLSAAEAPLIYVNCSSIPATLFESELFGHEKGSFTGAASQKKGRVELAHGGTLLLDEITEIPFEIQAKLLDFLQERTFYRVGGVTPVTVDIRIIALTNKNLQEEIKSGKFRKDLYYRLNVIHFNIPPLRERGADVILISEYLLSLLRRKYNSSTIRISEQAIGLIRAYAWPGNVRELKNALERAFICADGDVIEANALNLEEQEHGVVKRRIKDMIDEFERDVILRRLSFFKGSRTQTAQDLGISIRNLQYKLEKYDIR